MWTHGDRLRDLALDLEPISLNALIGDMGTGLRLLSLPTAIIGFCQEGESFARNFPSRRLEPLCRSATGLRLCRYFLG